MTTLKPKKPDRAVGYGDYDIDPVEKILELEKKLESLKRHLVGSMRWEDVGG